MKLLYTSLVNLNNQASAVATINSNMAAIQAAMEKTLSRDVTSPNVMEAALDMNGKHILNLPAPSLGTDPVRLQDVTGPISIITNNNIIYYNVLDFIPTNQHPSIQAYTSNYDATININTAIATAATTGGVLLFPRGKYYVTGTLGQPNMRNITLLGVGGRDLTYSANTGTVIYYVGTGSKIFDFTEARGCGCENFQVVQTSSSFTGRVFDCNQTNAIGSDLHFKRIQFYKIGTPYTCDTVWYLRNNVGNYFEECHVARAINAWKGLEDSDTGGIINENNVITLHKCLTIELSGSAIVNPVIGWSIIACNFEIGYLGAVAGVKSTPNKTVQNISFTDTICADATQPGTWIDLKDVAGFSWIGGSINGLTIPNGITGIKFSGTALSGASINGVNFGSIDNGINFNTSILANGVSVTGNTFLNVTNPYVNIANVDSYGLLQGNNPSTANRVLNTQQGGTGTTSSTGTGANVLANTPTIDGFPTFTGTPQLAQGINVLDGNSNFKAKNGGDIAAVIYNTKNTGESVGFTFQDNSTTKWSFYKSAFNEFVLNDFPNSINSIAVTAGAVGVGHVDIGYSTAATSSTTGSLRNLGGLGNGGAGYFGGSLVAHSNTAVPAGGTAGAGLLVSSVTNLGIFFGSGVPTLSAAQGSLYIRTDGSSTSTRMYINTNGTTGWTAVTTAT